MATITKLNDNEVEMTETKSRTFNKQELERMKREGLKRIAFLDSLLDAFK